jgi:hypothetical protein
MKVAELERALLDYWVARALGYKSGNDVPSTLTGEWSDGSGFRNAWQPSNEWGQGGPIIEREGLAIYQNVDKWICLVRPEAWAAGSLTADTVLSGPTSLVAAMRAYVASKFGDEIEVEDTAYRL